MTLMWISVRESVRLSVAGIVLKALCQNIKILTVWYGHHCSLSEPELSRVTHLARDMACFYAVSVASRLKEAGPGQRSQNCLDALG